MSGYTEFPPIEPDWVSKVIELFMQKMAEMVLHFERTTMRHDREIKQILRFIENYYGLENEEEILKKIHEDSPNRLEVDISKIFGEIDKLKSKQLVIESQQSRNEIWLSWVRSILEKDRIIHQDVLYSSDSGDSEELSL